jgi:tetratricopeptide (TPR) repeat protein
MTQTDVMMARRIRGHVDGFKAPGSFFGWALDASRHEAPVTVELRLLGEPLATCRTSFSREDLLSAPNNRAGFNLVSRIPIAPLDLLEGRLEVAADGDVIPFSAGISERLSQPSCIEHFAYEAAAAQHRGDIESALAQWLRTARRFAQSTLGYLEAAALLKQLGRDAEADAVLCEARAQHRDDLQIAVEHARAAHRMSDWIGALARWRSVAARHPGNADGVAGFGLALQMLQRFDEADDVLADGMARSPGHAGLAVEWARVPHRRRDWAAALRRWRRVVADFPNDAEAHSGVAAVLAMLRRHDELEEFLAKAAARFPETTTFAIDFARNAESRGDWTEAVRRWEAAIMRFPASQALLDGRRRARFHRQFDDLGLPAEQPGADAAQDDVATSETSRDIVMRFESLGSGCEFGLVQRKFGAEPLGLLRWGAIPPLALADALHARFAGAGDPEDVSLFEFGGNKEYFFRDRKYSLEMHTFVPVAGSDYERVFSQQCRRASYLRDKLLADLDDPAAFNKILVYKAHFGSLSDSDALAIHTAIVRYGRHTLLCIRPADEAHPDGTLCSPLDGLLFGYIDGLSPASDANKINYESWLRVCQAALARTRTAAGWIVP